MAQNQKQDKRYHPLCVVSFKEAPPHVPVKKISVIFFFELKEDISHEWKEKRAGAILCTVLNILKDVLCEVPPLRQRELEVLEVTEEAIEGPPLGFDEVVKITHIYFPAVNFYSSVFLVVPYLIKIAHDAYTLLSP